MGRPLSRGFARCCDQGFQGHAIWDHQGAAVLLDEVLLLEARESRLTVSREVTIICPISS
jgi:hypothetical protein